MRFRVGLVVVIAAASIVSSGRPAVARQPDNSGSATVSQLLKNGWAPTAEARRSAAALFQEHEAKHPNDPQVLYAYALVQMQQRQYADAVKALDRLLAIDKQNLTAWRARSWISTLTKDHAAALVQLDRISQLLADAKAAVPTDPGQANTVQNEQRELVEYLGRMFGYFEGPSKGSVNATTLESAKRKVIERLGESMRTQFEQARSSVIDQFDLLATAKDDAQVQEIMAAEKVKRDTQTRLAQEQSDIALRRDQLNQSAEKVREESASEIASAQRADQPLLDQLNQHNAQHIVVENELARVTGDILILRAEAARERDPVLLDGLLRQINRLEILAARINADLAVIDGQIVGVQRQRAALAAKHRQAQAGFAASLARIDKDFQAIETRTRRIAAEQARLAKPAVGNTGKVISLSKQAQALTTYEAFPLEQEKQRLLDLIK